MKMVNIQELSAQGEYEIERRELERKHKIGQGNFGVVLKGSWRGTDVAIKEIYNVSEDDINVDEFSKELEILCKVHHPNILQFLGACTLSVPYSIVMEYMINGSLGYHLIKGDLTDLRKLYIAQDIARGLAYLHNRKPQCIIHRDLKPGNILLTASYKAKIADFGISALKQKSDEQYDMTGETGTYRYMAPEVLMHKPYSTNVDIWSYGMILYHMYIELPFSGMDMKTMFLCISNSTFNFKIKYEQLNRVFQSCIKFDPNERLDSLSLVYIMNSMKLEHKSKKTLMNRILKKMNSFYNKTNGQSYRH